MNDKEQKLREAACKYYGTYSDVGKKITDIFVDGAMSPVAKAYHNEPVDVEELENEIDAIYDKHTAPTGGGYEADYTDKYGFISEVIELIKPHLQQPENDTQKRYSIEEVDKILTDYRMFAWVNGLAAKDLNEWKRDLFKSQRPESRLSVDQILSNFSDEVKDRFNTDAMFRSCVIAISRGTSPFEVIGTFVLRHEKMNKKLYELALLCGPQSPKQKGWENE